MPSSTSGSTDSKRPYGGLVPSQPKGTRAYQDAATYNHQLAQHQVYTAQAQAAQANTVYRNPYVTQQQQQQQPSQQQQQQQQPPQYPIVQEGNSGYTSQHHSQYSASQ